MDAPLDGLFERKCDVCKSVWRGSAGDSCASCERWGDCRAFSVDYGPINLGRQRVERFVKPTPDPLTWYIEWSYEQRRS